MLVRGSVTADSGVEKSSFVYVLRNADMGRVSELQRDENETACRYEFEVEVRPVE